jgi:hypothetical protein
MKIVFRHGRCLSRSSIARAMAWLLALSLVLTGAPRWEQHAHTVSEVADTHSHMFLDDHADHRHADGDKVDGGKGDGEGEVLVIHAHVTTAQPFNLPSVAGLTLLAPVNDAWSSNRDVPTPTATLLVPPYRPPIA